MSEPALLDRALLGTFPLPDHPSDGDKSDRGLALVIAGSRELPGAALLAGLGALRAGAGKLRIGTAQSVVPGLGVAIPEARVIAFGEGDRGCIAPGAVEALVERCRGADSLTIGPGMQEGDGLSLFLSSLLASRHHRLLVLDAAALAVLPRLAPLLRDRTGGAVLLPHRGEMAQLLECDAEDVARDPLAAARDAAAAYGAVTLIKGEWSFIVAPDGRCFAYLGGGIGQATSGSGDVLAGIVGGLAARGADPLTAALWGVYLHGEAGRILGRNVGRIGFLARELLDLIPGLMDGFSLLLRQGPGMGGTAGKR